MDFLEGFPEVPERLQLFVRSLASRSRLPGLLKYLEPGEADRGRLAETDLPIQIILKSRLLARLQGSQSLPVAFD